ncbi:terminase gpA endonuclease subunit [Ensifer sp. 4252]|uniref:terminase gpA endonuclease subunit n=1 Tax=Ensifer sp. 4252 TaxID=3373915 RepID=UPI003D1A7097
MHTWAGCERNCRAISIRHGKGFRDGGDELDEDELRSRTEPFGLADLPPDILFVTAGIDLQDQWADWVLTGHSRTETFVLANGQIYGRFDSDDLWAEVDDLLKTIWQHPRGAHIGISAALIDSGDGEHQPHVYAFARPRFGRKVAASKGMAGFSRPPLQRSNVKGQSVFIVGSDAIKNSIFNRLSAGKSIRFAGSLEARFFEELVSERRIVRYTRGQPTRASSVSLAGEPSAWTLSPIASRLAASSISISTDENPSFPAPPRPKVGKTVFRSAFLAR